MDFRYAGRHCFTAPDFIGAACVPSAIYSSSFVHEYFALVDGFKFFSNLSPIVTVITDPLGFIVYSTNFTASLTDSPREQEEAAELRTSEYE